MTPISGFTLRHDAPREAGRPGALLHEGRETGIELDAAMLNAQFRVPPERYLLFFTDDCPYEEELQIILLDKDLRLLDGVKLGGMYTPGILSDIRQEGENQLSFSFFSDLRTTLQLHPEGLTQLIRRLPPLVKPLRHRFLSKHYLSVRNT
ncbi:hypothetical protein F0U59_31375 [Archangium gephyra]|nr:hypothetical protein F0U59_31375 [Archangium gephyra]